MEGRREGRLCVNYIVFQCLFVMLQSKFDFMFKVLMLQIYCTELYHSMIFCMNNINMLLKAYLESKSKMCIFSLANTNQNPVVLSLCLVFLNAQINAPNSSLNFCCGRKCKDVRLWRNDVTSGIKSLSPSFQSAVRQMHSGVMAIAREIQGNFPLVTSHLYVLYVKKRAENGPTDCIS